MGVDDIKSGLKILAFLIPPLDSDPVRRFRYDASVSLSIFIGGLLVTVHILWLCGFLAWAGIAPPFAASAQVQEARERMDLQQAVLSQIQAGQLNDKIRDAKTRVCLAIRANDQSALDAWGRELEIQKQRYRDVMRLEPFVMGCDELLVGVGKQ